ncbi:MAG: hypothetical protein J6L79_00025 [Muribaculaceae bacterium]|nr:hypothetical protein [Muribaculaceae bacterium]
MKKLLFVFLCVFCAINANAQFKFKSLDNNDGKTTVVIVDDNFKQGSETCCAKFNNDGKTYDATSMVTTQEGKNMSVTMTFKRMTVFNNTSITLTVNGQHVNVPIELTEIAGQLSGYKLLIP